MKRKHKFKFKFKFTFKNLIFMRPSPNGMVIDF